MPSSPPIITIIGSLNIDLVSHVSRLPAGGETLTSSSFHVGCGGKGANQAVACAKLSRSQGGDHGSPSDSAVVKMVGAVGDDAHGEMMLVSLTNYGVDVTGVRVQPETHTGVAVIIVEETSGENRIMLSAEANATLTPAHFPDLGRALPALLIMQLEIPLACVLHLLELARALGVPVLLNPAPAVPIPDNIFPAITHLVLNESEAVLLADCDPAALDHLPGLLAVGTGFHQRGAINVIITLGGRGVFYADPGTIHGLEPALKVEVVDTTAAGDTFVGAYALEVVKPGVFDLQAAVRKANRAAAKTVGRKGAQESIPWADEL